MSSVVIQVTAILQSNHKSDITLESIKPVRYDHGIYFRVSYRTADEPEKSQSRYFGHQRFWDCCDVWLESPSQNAA